MKEIRKSVVFPLLICILVVGLTACYGDSNNSVQSTPAAETTGNYNRETNGNGTNGSTAETGGVIDGLMDDVSRGINDMTGGTSAGME